jgi:TolB-like protein/tetratricopeptide (TPR) repeat protein
LERPFEAYRGDEPYVFICYAHDDQAVVYPEITWLHEQSVNVWYDEGISPGEEWSEELGQAIEGAERFLYFVSPRSVASRHCRNELNFAQNHDKAILSVYLENTELPSGVELVIGASQAIVRPDFAEADYRARLLRALGRSEQTRPGPTRSVPRTSHVTWGLVGLLLLAVAAFVALLERSPRDPGEGASTLDRSIAVLPFKGVGSELGAAPYADALTEDLRTVITRYQELRSVSIADSSMPQDVDQASYVLDGSLQQAGGRARVRARLMRTSDDQEVWADAFERPFTAASIDTVELATVIGRFVRLQLMLDQRCETVRRTSRSDEAAAAYCAAFSEYFRLGQLGNIDTELELSNAQRALALDPEIADAYRIVARVHIVFATILGLLDWREAAREAHSAIQHGLALAPDNPYLLNTRGQLQHYLEFDYPGAEASYRAALDRDPRHPNAYQNHAALGELALQRGKLDEALAHRQRALRVYDSDAASYLGYAVTLLFAGRYRDTLDVIDEGLALMRGGYLIGPLYGVKAEAHIALGETAEARAAIDKVIVGAPQMRLMLAASLVSVGRTDEVRALLSQLEAMADPPITGMVLAYVALDDERVFEWLHRAIDHRINAIIAGLRLAPVFARLREDPRWHEVMAHLEAEEAKGSAGQNRQS